MDLAMPVLNGLDATRAIKRVKPGIPVILFSGFSGVLEEKEARSVGISALVPKSDPSNLLDVAHQLLRQVLPVSRIGLPESADLGSQILLL